LLNPKWVSRFSFGFPFTCWEPLIWNIVILLCYDDCLVFNKRIENNWQTFFFFVVPLWQKKLSYKCEMLTQIISLTVHNWLQMWRNILLKRQPRIFCFFNDLSKMRHIFLKYLIPFKIRILENMFLYLSIKVYNYLTN